MAKAQFQDLIDASTAALNDPDTNVERLRELLEHCATGLRCLITDRTIILGNAHTQIVEIASIIDRQEMAWPEDVARLDALSAEIRQRAALFAGDQILNP